MMKESMLWPIWSLFKREFFSYFRSPVAYVFMIIFILASVGCAFFLGGLYEGNQASLVMFFTFLPWLYLVLVPAVGMKLWAEERRSGTIELLLTLPIDLSHVVVAKFLAGWAFISIATLLSFPLAITVNYLGEPDNGVILTSYLGAILMAGSYLSITCLTSALTKNQVVSFILGVIICFVLVLVGWGVFTSLLATIFPAVIIDFIASLGFMTHFISISRGVIDTRAVIYFISVIVVALSLNSLVLQQRKAS